ncbi:MAG: IS110 family transposase [Qipengyuania citrea]|jgi:transposase|uniref:IS110 family transposase n=1 Tax=Alphaproteobacteria TaxID=28211 RepID=UPI000C4741E3|nr:IS110 family transposase [Citromicrobium sp.]MAO05539.1 IS110 family transposase [Citromicrobium sp.]MAO05833.1 IS110 family transposase [Citromicrobium sp.]MBL4793750.1 IS110 family transposase [Citromicrobium sp.]MCP5396138.1 IS110 family transposase [Sphingomonadaceae bacterium]|tara:strand:- start:339 stop:1358 length:1020 start_codon:yes stop_codon:yes gene_type:complete
MEKEVVTVGLDLAKNVFQIHAIGSDGTVLVRRKLRRAEVIRFFTDLPACLVGMEACASAHHWGRELMALGHEVRLMPPAYVKPYVKRGKTDAADAEAICEAVTRPTMRFVAVKTVEQQAVLMLHKSRDLLVRQRTMLINALRGHLAEYGIVTRVGAGGVTASLQALHDEQSKLPDHARSALHGIAAQLRALSSEIDRLETQILAWHRNDETSCRLATIPGIGPITASAIAAAVPDASLFRSGRQFAAWLGLTPRPHSSGGKERLGGITKQGDGYLRRLLVVGATAVMRMARKDASRQPWMAQLLERKPTKIATVALANKTARIAWAVMARKEVYTPVAV